jgi:putative SOS response-associated peptidase YedK
MCGRITQTRPPEELTRAFGLDAAPALPPRYNIAPSQPIVVVRIGAAGREAALARWGLVPAWTKERPTDAGLINARADTVAIKPSFRSAFRRRRCLIPADGFYEWQRLPRGKQPYYIHRAHRLFAFAGLWEHWEGEGGAIESCTIITTDANDLMRPIHDRMPVIIDADAYPLWLGERDAPPDALAALLRARDVAGLAAYPVSPVVNSPRNDSAVCIAPAGA